MSRRKITNWAWVWLFIVLSAVNTFVVDVVAASVSEDNMEQKMVGNIPDFNYPDKESAVNCTRSYMTIRNISRDVLRGIVAIGNELIKVKGYLGHSIFITWVYKHFNWSLATAGNYMNASRAVANSQDAWELQPGVLYLLTGQVPMEIQEQIFQEKPSIAEARVIIFEAKIESLIDTDPGAAYHEIEKALVSISTSDAAKKALVAHSEILSRLSGREQAEILAEGGVSFEERFSGDGNDTRVSFYETDDGHTLVVWLNENVSTPVTIASFPRLNEPKAIPWQNQAIKEAVRITRAKVMEF